MVSGIATFAPGRDKTTINIIDDDGKYFKGVKTLPHKNANISGIDIFVLRHNTEGCT